MTSLQGKCAFITGTKRIGSFVARALHREGVRVTISYHRTDPGPLAQELNAFTVQGDVSNESDVTRMLKSSYDHFGSLDFIIHLASNYVSTPLNTLDGAAWDDGLKEAKGHYLITLYGSRLMHAGGHIILFGDSAITGPLYPNHIPYFAAKGAVHTLTRAFAKELAPKGILVNAIAPGATLRPSSITPDHWQRNVTEKTALRRGVNPEDLADMTIALLKNKSLTGEVFCVDAGKRL